VHYNETTGELIGIADRVGVFAVALWTDEKDKIDLSGDDKSVLTKEELVIAGAAALVLLLLFCICCCYCCCKLQEEEAYGRFHPRLLVWLRTPITGRRCKMNHYEDEAHEDHWSSEHQLRQLPLPFGEGDGEGTAGTEGDNEETGGDDDKAGGHGEAPEEPAAGVGADQEATPGGGRGGVAPCAKAAAAVEKDVEEHQDMEIVYVL
jgi:hypothetical protein